MKKMRLTKLALTLAFLVFGVGGVTSVKARTNVDMSTASSSSKATWTAATNTFTWTAEGEYVVIPGLSGDLTGCYLDFTISDACRIDIHYTDGTTTTGNWNGYGRFGSSGSKTQDLGFMAGSKINIVDEVRIASTSASGSITITAVSYFYPVIPQFNASGVATINLKSLVATGGLTFNPSTGVVTCDGTEGTLALEFLSGIDLTSLKRYDVAGPGNDAIIWRSIMKSQGTDVLGYYGSRWGGNLTAAERTKATAVNEFFWETKSATDLEKVAEGDRTFTITSITLTADAMQLSNPNSLIVAGPYAKWTDVTSSAAIDEAATPAWNVGSATGTVYGDVNVNSLYYANLKDFKTMKIYVNASSATIRAMFNREAGNGAYFNVQVDPSNGTLTESSYSSYADGVFTIDLAKILAEKGTVHLNAIKAAAGQSNAYVDKVILDPITPCPYNYVLSGQYSSATDISDFTSDASATAIDCSSLSGNNVTLTSANPNCLFVAKAGVLSNSKNVITSGICAKLELTDGAYNFKAPDVFTANSVSYDRTFTAGNMSTICLPFALSTSEAAALGTFYTLDELDGTSLRFVEAESGLTANTHYLFMPTATAILGYSDKPIEATPAEIKTAVTGAEFIGTMTAQTLKSDGSNTLYGYKGGKFVKVGETNGAKINPFRAYISIPASLAPSLDVILEDANLTGISEIEKKNIGSETYFNLNGQRIANPAKGLYIVNGRKVVIK